MAKDAVYWRHVIAKPYVQQKVEIERYGHNHGEHQEERNLAAIERQTIHGVVPVFGKQLYHTWPYCHEKVSHKSLQARLYLHHNGTGRIQGRSIKYVKHNVQALVLHHHSCVAENIPAGVPEQLFIQSLVADKPYAAFRVLTVGVKAVEQLYQHRIGHKHEAVEYQAVANVVRNQECDSELR